MSCTSRRAEKTLSIVLASSEGGLVKVAVLGCNRPVFGSNLQGKPDRRQIVSKLDGHCTNLQKWFQFT